MSRRDAAWRVLVATPYELTSPPNGGTLRTWAVAEALVDAGADVVVAAPADSVLRPGSRAMLVAGPRRVRSLRHRVLETLAPGPTSGRTARRRLAPEVARLLAHDAVDVAVLEHTAAAAALAELAVRHGAPWVLDLVDVEERRSLQATRRVSGGRKLVACVDAHRMRRAERRLIACADVVAVVSDQDEAHVRRLGQPRVVHAPNGVDARFFSVPPPAPGRSWTFTGDLSYAPNVRGLRWLRDEVLPRLPPHEARVVRLVGRRPDPELREWARLDDGIELVADPIDVLPWLSRTSYCLNPVQEGGGTSLKTLEYAAAARPFVSTSFGARGFPSVAGAERADTAAAFAQHMAGMERLDDPAPLGASVRGRARDRTWDRVLADLVEASRRVARR
jgi:hypothetical protein